VEYKRVGVELNFPPKSLKGGYKVKKLLKNLFLRKGIRKEYPPG